MKFYYYSRHNTNLFNSLKRYFKYILNVQLNFLTINSEANKNVVLFLLNDEKEEKELIDVLISNEEIKVVTLGIDNKSSINIINLTSLKNFLQKIINGNYEDLKPLFTEEEIKERLKSFFHSHGEDSLFEYLNWTIYYFLNGPLQLITSNISYNDYLTSFISKGLMNWKNFKEKFLKHMYIIKFSNLQLNYCEIKNLVNEFDLYVDKLYGMPFDEIIKKKEKLFFNNIDKVRRIADILEEIYRNLSFGRPTLQNPSD